MAATLRTRCFQVEKYLSTAESFLAWKPSSVSIPSSDTDPQRVLIKVHAIGLNFADGLMCQGKYQVRPPLPFVPGAEFSGEVFFNSESSLSPDCFAVGTRVMGFSNLGGAFSEYMWIDKASLVAIPNDMSYTDAAAFGVSYPTAYHGLVHRLGVTQGSTDSILVHAAAGGTGSAAVQIGAALGCKIIAVCSGSSKKQLLSTFVQNTIAAPARAAVTIVDGTTENVADIVKTVTKGKGVSIIFDPVGGDEKAVEANLKMLGFNGKYAVIGFAGGKIPSFPANKLLLKSQSVHGVYWGGSVERSADIRQDAFDALFAMHRSGSLRPLIYKPEGRGPFAFDDLPTALTHLMNRSSTGKVVVNLSFPAKL